MPSPNPAGCPQISLSKGCSLVGPARSGALALELHRQRCTAAPASKSFRFFPLSSSPPNASDRLPGGCPAEVRASPFGRTTSYFSCRAQATLTARRDPRGPPRLCVCRVRGCFCGSARPIHSLRLLFVSRTDSSARIDAWEKLIAACSCCSRAPLQLPCPADAPGNRGGGPCGSQLLLATECRRAESRIQALFFFLFWQRLSEISF